MLCKKCGAKIEENSKFCGYCGNKVEKVEVNNQPSMENVDTNEVVKTNYSFNNQINNDMEETTRIEVVQTSNEVVNEQPVIDTPVMNNNTMNNQVSMNNQMPMNNSQNATVNKKNNNKLIFIIGGIALAILAVVIVVLVVTKTSSTSIAVLQKSLANLEEKSSGSLTLDAKLAVESNKGESFSFSATMKIETENENKGKIQLTVNKSMFFEEINAYAEVDKDEVTLYAKSDLIDMLGYTSSETPMWLYYTEAIVNEDKKVIEEKVDEVDFEDLIDEEHFVFIDESEGVKHYQLIIDQKLVDNIKVKLKDVEDENVKDMLNSTENIEKPVKLDFYINNKNDLTKIALDLAPYMEEDSNFKKFEVSLEFSGLNSTKVEIPSEAKKSTTDFETYMTTYSSFGYTQNDYSFDTNYDTSVNTDLNNALYGF